MARSPYVWGIDIGKAALKALRCRPGDGSRRLVIDAFEYIEYPTFLSQPDADAAELVRNALAELTARHNLAGDTVAVSVPGQLGLTKFIKLPPIEAKKIPDIVKYEARQQIPFPLDQVVWSWQRLAGGMEESGFVIDAEVALFAMKSDQVEKTLAPLVESDVRVDILQLAPIALANLAMFDLLPDPAEIDPDKPPPSVALVSMGVDSTDLVVTNGLRIWQRSISIGGNSFTKALIKDQKLTFARAEEVKRNAVRAEDPKAVYTAMRPVFDDFALELQRSLSYFTSTDRTAEIGSVFMLGNAAGLRGLSDFVGKQLQLPVRRFELYRHLDAEEALQKPLFRDNRLAFGTSYGLAVQAAGRAGIQTSLLPRRIVLERQIDAKKPWAAAALSGLLIAALVAFAGGFLALRTFDEKLYAGALGEADRAKARSQTAEGSLAGIVDRQKQAVARQDYLLAVQSRRFQTLDMVRAVESLLPRDDADKRQKPIPIADRNEIYVERMDCQSMPDLSAWFASVKKQWELTHPGEAAAEPAEEVGAEEEQAEPAADADPAPGDTAEKASRPADGGGDPPADGAAAADAAPAAEPAAGEGDEGAAAPATPATPEGAGWVIEIAGHHFHNEPHHKPEEAAQFLRSTLIKNLSGKGRKVVVAGGPRAGEEVSVEELGIGFPVIISSSPVRTIRIADESRVEVAADRSMPGQAGFPRPPGRVEPRGDDDDAGEGDGMITLRRYDFVVQFVWKPRTPGAPEPPAAKAPAASEEGGG
jgi:type IV pilus assembly protein PilM